MVGIVGVQIAAGVRLAAERVSVGDGTGRVGGSIGAIGTALEHTTFIEAGDIERRRQREFWLRPPSRRRQRDVVSRR